jgi:ADP-ribose pyrophosphatase YjhB (NUDIX family)
MQLIGHPQVAAAVVLVREASKRYLLVKRGKAPRKGSWSLPGGRVEFGEPSLTAASRELAEETNLDHESAGVVFHPRSVTASDAIFRKPNDGLISFHYSIVQHVAFIRTNDDHLPDQVGRAQDDAADLRWFTRHEIEECENLGGDVLAVVDWVQMLIDSKALLAVDASAIPVPPKGKK